jgi:hypothetical protein
MVWLRYLLILSVLIAGCGYRYNRNQKQAPMDVVKNRLREMAADEDVSLPVLKTALQKMKETDAAQAAALEKQLDEIFKLMRTNRTAGRAKAKSLLESLS